jgi:P27 family predicted phage terminase small subunit
MDTESRQLWHKVTDDLHDLGILACVDGPTLVRYVSMLAQWQRLAKFLQEHGETYEVRHSYKVPERTDADGKIIPRHTVDTVRHELRPQAKLALALAERLLRLERQFGMTSGGYAGIGAALNVARKVTSGHRLTLDPRRFLRLERLE